MTQKPSVNPRDNKGKQTGKNNQTQTNNSWGSQGTTRHDRSQKGWNQKEKTNGLFQRTITQI